MTYLRFAPIGHNVWAVKRLGVTRAEIVLSASDGRCRLIPVSSYALDQDEIEGMLAFMKVAHEQKTAITKAS